MTMRTPSISITLNGPIIKNIINSVESTHMLRTSENNEKYLNASVPKVFFYKVPQVQFSK